MIRRTVWVAGVGLFAALSAADFVQTYALVEGGTALEGNPVAAAWLARYGWAGMAAFKGLLTLVVFGAVLLLARRGSPAGGRVLALGCAVLLGVGLYSRGLLTAPAADEEPPADLAVVVPADPSWVTRPVTMTRVLPRRPG